MMQHKFSALALAGALLCAPFTSVVTASSAAPHNSAPFEGAAAVQQDDTPPDAEQAMFTKGQNFYNQGRYDQAASIFRDFLKNYPNSIITDLTLLWLGRTYIAQGRLPDAEGVVARLRTIKDTPFVEIYEGELQAAQTERAAAARSTTAAQPAATPAATTTTRQETAQVTPTPNRPTSRMLPTPTPTPRLIARSTPPRPRPTPLPTPTPQVARVSPPVMTTTPTLTIDNPSANTPPVRRSRRNGSRFPSRRTQPQRTNTDTEIAANTPVVVPRPTPTPVPARPRASVAAPTPVAIARAEPNQSVTTAPPIVNSAPNGQEGFVLTVKQVPNLALALSRVALPASPGQAVQLPLTVTNSGNKEDQFRLETDLPAEYQPTFSLASGGQDTGLPYPRHAATRPQSESRSAAQPARPRNRQRRPATSVHRARRLASDYQIHRVSNAALTVVAAALAGSSGVTRESVQPGETFTQTISVRNNGSAAARSSRTDFVFSPTLNSSAPARCRSTTTILRAQPSGVSAISIRAVRGKFPSRCVPCRALSPQLPPSDAGCCARPACPQRQTMTGRASPSDACPERALTPSRPA
jgi:predicted negative regulator of RcsB-dependent stress response